MWKGALRCGFKTAACETTNEKLGMKSLPLGDPRIAHFLCVKRNYRPPTVFYRTGLNSGSSAEVQEAARIPGTPGRRFRVFAGDFTSGVIVRPRRRGGRGGAFYDRSDVVAETRNELRVTLKGLLRFVGRLRR